MLFVIYITKRYIMFKQNYIHCDCVHCVTLYLLMLKIWHSKTISYNMWAFYYIIFNICWYSFLGFCFLVLFFVWFLAWHFWRQYQAIVIARSSSSCNIQKVLKVSAPYLEYLLIMTRCNWKTWVITLKATFLELCPFLTENFT